MAVAPERAVVAAAMVLRQRRCRFAPGCRRRLATVNMPRLTLHLGGRLGLRFGALLGRRHVALLLAGAAALLPRALAPPAIAPPPSATLAAAVFA